VCDSPGIRSEESRKPKPRLLSSVDRLMSEVEVFDVPQLPVRRNTDTRRSISNGASGGSGGATQSKRADAHADVEEPRDLEMLVEDLD
jgi:hypothetical protein